MNHVKLLSLPDTIKTLRNGKHPEVYESLLTLTGLSTENQILFPALQILSRLKVTADELSLWFQRYQAWSSSAHAQLTTILTDPQAPEE